MKSLRTRYYVSNKLADFMNVQHGFYIDYYSTIYSVLQYTKFANINLIDDHYKIDDRLRILFPQRDYISVSTIVNDLKQYHLSLQKFPPALPTIHSSKQLLNDTIKSLYYAPPDAMITRPPVFHKEWEGFLEWKHELYNLFNQK